MDRKTQKKFDAIVKYLGKDNVKYYFSITKLVKHIVNGKVKHSQLEKLYKEATQCLMKTESQKSPTEEANVSGLEDMGKIVVVEEITTHQLNVDTPQLPVLEKQNTANGNAPTITKKKHKGEQK